MAPDTSDRKLRTLVSRPLWLCAACKLLVLTATLEKTVPPRVKQGVAWRRAAHTCGSGNVQGARGQGGRRASSPRASTRVRVRAPRSCTLASESLVGFDELRPERRSGFQSLRRLLFFCSVGTAPTRYWTFPS